MVIWYYTDPILVFYGIFFAFRPDCGKVNVLIRKIWGNRFGKGCFLSSAIFVPKKNQNWISIYGILIPNQMPETEIIC